MNNINSCDKYSPLPVDQKYSLLPDDDIVSCIWEEAGCLYWWVPLLEEEDRVAEPETRTTPAMDQSHSQDPGHVDHHPDLGTNQRSVLYYCINQSEKSIALYQPIREEYYLEEAVEQLQAEQVSCSVSWPRDWTWRSWSLPDLSTNQRLVLYCINQSEISIALCQPIRIKFSLVLTNQERLLPRTPNLCWERESGGRDFLRRNFQVFFMLSGSSPWSTCHVRMRF